MKNAVQILEYPKAGLKQRLEAYQNKGAWGCPFCGGRPEVWAVFDSKNKPMRAQIICNHCGGSTGEVDQVYTDPQTGKTHKQDPIKRVLDLWCNSGG